MVVPEGSMTTMEKVLTQSCTESNPTVTFLSEADKGQKRVARILEPKDGSFYAHDAHIPADHQKMAVRLLVPDGAGRAQLIIDGVLVKTETLSESLLLWPMTKGKHKLKARFQIGESEWIETEDVEIKVF